MHKYNRGTAGRWVYNLDKHQFKDFIHECIDSVCTDIESNTGIINNLIRELNDLMNLKLDDTFTDFDSLVNPSAQCIKLINHIKHLREVNQDIRSTTVGQLIDMHTTLYFWTYLSEDEIKKIMDTPTLYEGNVYKGHLFLMSEYDCDGEEGYQCYTILFLGNNKIGFRKEHGDEHDRDTIRPFEIITAEELPSYMLLNPSRLVKLVQLVKDINLHV